MYKLPKILLISFLLLSLTGISQDYNYIHYTNKDGLASNTVYAACQNNEGYIFFATTYGLCRFDGKVFKTFTVDDGLPDNDILNVFSDRKGRVWMLPFAKSLCYYYKGKIFNSNNDSTLKKMAIKGVVRFIFEDNDSNVVFNSPNEAVVLYTNNKVSCVTKSIGSKYNTNQDCRQNTFGEGLILLKDSDSLFLIMKESVKYIGPFNPTNRNYRLIVGEYMDSNRLFDQIILPKKFVSFNAINGKVTYINTSNGALKVVANKITNQCFLQGKKVYNTFEDSEKNIWFSTFGEGVYKLPSAAIKVFANQSNKEVFSIEKYKNKIIAGIENNSCITITKDKFSNVKYENRLSVTDNAATHKLICIKKVSNNQLILGFETFVLNLKNGFKKSEIISLGSIKSIEFVDSNSMVVSTHSEVVVLDINSSKIVDTIWSDRSTKSFFYKNFFYIGTVDGLYKVSKDKKSVYLGEKYPILKHRITDIKVDNFGTMWIATGDAGVVAFKNDKIVAEASQKNGLLSNITNNLHIQQNFLWVGTIKGINKIDLLTNKVISKYTSSDGLPSDIINAIYYDAEDSSVWVGTPEGLTNFKEKDIIGQSICKLGVENITVSKNSIKIDSNNFQLKYTDNNIKFDYAAISLRSGDDIIYTYKLIGLDTAYKTTTERNLNYETLPFGSYTLILFATNKFGLKSNVFQFSFTIATPFWKTNWFTALIFLLGFAIMFGFIYWRYKRLQARNYERANFKVQLANMEQQALQAQMNPHFIFNCLNSIQQFILFKETEKANKYLILFSRLIRNTLDNSDKKNITLADEKIYLEQYLELEQMRFGDKFIYNINIESSIDIDEVMIPAMLLQPFLENSLRHGIRQLKDRNGIIAIEFKQRNGYLYCHIKDDGIGREAAEKLKTNMHIEYQSKGVNLTNKRVELLNTNLKNKINIEMIDCKDEIGVATGTEVIVMIPINLE